VRYNGSIGRLAVRECLMNNDMACDLEGQSSGSEPKA